MQDLPEIPEAHHLPGMVHDLQCSSFANILSHIDSGNDADNVGFEEPVTVFFNSAEGVNSSQAGENGSELSSPALCRRFHFTSSGIFRGNHLQVESNSQKNIMQITKHSMLTCAPYSTEASSVDNDSTGTAKEVCDKMLICVAEKRTAAPNAWLWLLVERCSNNEDIKLPFDIL
ncbi:uncharacterized protein Fot_02471 [Forsythia ovata]|uniref:Uncharacterized protein n=1 Tax=Forsythia ovata TaxID=205694 RepID=A0ABD1X7F8_9LAMI